MLEPSPNLLSLLVFLALPPLVLGLVLMKMAYLTRRRGHTPHCRKCNYTLTGLSSDRCPECGQSLDGERAIVHGERTHRPILGAVGSLLLLLALASGVIILASDRVEWYRYKPTGWVIDDSGSPASAIAIRAWNELYRRMQDGALSESQHQKLTEVALAEQGKGTAGPIGQQLMDYLGTRAEEGKLSEAQKARFVDQGAKYALDVRERIGKGDPVYYRLAQSGRGPSRDWFSNRRVREIRINGTPIQRSGFGSSGSSFGGNGATSSSISFEEPGDHTMEVDIEETVRHGRSASSDRGPVFLKRTVTLKSNFTILADPPADLVTLKSDEAVRGLLLANIQARKAVLEPDSKHLHVSIDCNPLPANVAFDVFGRIGEEELRFGTMTLEKNRQMGFGTGGDLEKFIEKHGRPKRVTIILRSSKEVAKRSIEIYDAWEGELVFEDVMVSDKW